MGKTQKNQNGFSAVEGLLILVIVGLIGFVGWYVWNANKNTQDTLNASSKSSQSVQSSTVKPAKSDTVSYADDSKTYILSYPKGWTIDSLKWNGGSGHSIEAVANSYAQFDIPNAPDSTPTNAFTFIVRNSGDLNAVLEDQLGAAQTDGSPFKPEELKINGNKALKQTVKNDSYTDENYFVTNGKVTVVAFFRVKQAADPTAGASAIDNSKYLSDFQATMNSLKFVN